MPLRSDKFTVEYSTPSSRLDVYLQRQYPAISRGGMRRLIDQGHVHVNGKLTKPAHHPKTGEVIEIFFPDARPAEAQPEAIPLDVLFEDESLLVINKTSGLVVHPAAGHEEHTLVNALLHHCQGSLSGIGGVARPGIVHRLDKDTSGCLVVAKNDETHLALSKQFADRTVKKIYQAVICGLPAHDGGEIHAAIARHPTHRKRMAVQDNGKGRAAHTSWQVVERLNHATFVEAQIHTGRTHQIRVHFQYLGHPLVGDATYGAKQNKKLQEQTEYTASRLLLHAKELILMHPLTQKRLHIHSPLPQDFNMALSALKKTCGKY